jgi:2-polyprenyl-6-hydroxyphenyl methylase/3-demethylubiquinone-9 3-methyltransferase
MAESAGTIDPANLALFGGLAGSWWDPDGPSRLLHRINPTRLGFIRDEAVAHFGREARARRPLAGLRALDIGCGAGLVAEPLARMGATVTGLDAGADVIAVARDHADAMGLAIDYRMGEVADLAAEAAARFDLVTCLEVVEHVTDVPAFLATIRRLVAPGGLLVFSTPNRTALSWGVLIGGAERVMKLIPEGGHHWTQFLTPDELTQKLAAAGFRVERLSGLAWSPMRGFHLSADLRVNYIGTAVPV